MLNCTLLLRLIQLPILPHHRLRIENRRLLQIRQSGLALTALTSAQRTRRRDLRGLPDGSDRRGVLQCAQERLGRLGRQVLVVVVVNLHHRRVDASSQTLDFGEGE